MEILVKGEKYLASATAVSTITKKCEAASAKILLPGYKEYECSQCGNIFPRFYASKSKLCCSCIQVNRKITAGDIVKVQSEYPKTTALQSIEEVESYYAEEKITCLLCGNEYKALSHTHLKHLHEVSAREYKLMFGLYLSKGLLGATSKEIHSDRLKSFMSAERRIPILKALHQRNAETPPAHVNYSHAPALIKKQKDAAIPAISRSSNHITKRKNMVSAPCSRCGCIVEVSEATAITKRCQLLCKTCRGVRHKESQQRWADKKGVDLKQFQSQCARRSYLKKKGEVE